MTTPAPLLPRVASGDAIIPSGIAAPSALLRPSSPGAANSQRLRSLGLYSHPRQTRAIRSRTDSGSPKRSVDNVESLIPAPQRDALPSVRVFTAPGPAGGAG